MALGVCVALGLRVTRQQEGLHVPAPQEARVPAEAVAANAVVMLPTPPEPLQLDTLGEFASTPSQTALANVVDKPLRVETPVQASKAPPQRYNTPVPIKPNVTPIPKLSGHSNHWKASNNSPLPVAPQEQYSQEDLWGIDSEALLESIIPSGTLTPAVVEALAANNNDALQSSKSAESFSLDELVEEVIAEQPSEDSWDWSMEDLNAGDAGAFPTLPPSPGAQIIKRARPASARKPVKTPAPAALNLRERVEDEDNTMRIDENMLAQLRSLN